MNKAKMRNASIVAAAFLACLTIRIFFELQDYGPESAIRRFNEAVKGNDLTALQNVTLDGRSDGLKGPKIRQMIANLYDWGEHGVPMQIERIERTGNEVRAGVVFSFPDGVIWEMTWVVQRRGKMWLVDANKTATILADRLSGGIRPRY